MLVVGHPGHELRVYGWLKKARPAVHVLTDGSGHDGTPRIASTSVLLESAGATRGSIYGRLSDRDIYSAILGSRHDCFIHLAEELAASLVHDRIELVAGDAIEGFNPSHDVCRYVINAAVRLASERSGRTIACYAFALEAAPHSPPGTAQSALDPVKISLSDAELDEKLRAAHSYTELRPEVERTLERHGTEPFRTEYLWPVDLSDPYGWDPRRIPYYESYGAERVASGAYEQVVTFRDHVKPIADALHCRCAATA